MALQFPENRREVSDRIKTDVQTRLPTSNPFFKNSFLESMIFGFAGRFFDLFENLKILQREVFPDTATEEFLERWGEFKGITRNPATRASGFVTMTGIAGTLIPVNTFFQSTNGNQYNSQASVTINVNNLSIDTLTQSGGLVTAKTFVIHKLGSGIAVTIAGAVETDYNGTFIITTTAEDEFTYQIETNPSSPATGTITAETTQASVEIVSEDFGQPQNLLSGETVTLGSPIAGVDLTGFVQFSEVSGGTDVENDEDLRERILDRYQKPPTPFNANNIIQVARTVPGVTRVFVDEASTVIETGIPVSSITQADNVAIVSTSVEHDVEGCDSIDIAGANESVFNRINERLLLLDDFRFAYNVPGTGLPASATGTLTFTRRVPCGQVRVSFMRDNDDTPIPSAQEVADVKDKLVTELLPAHTDPRDLVVFSPEAVVVDFTFTALVPDSTTMREAVTANLVALFEDETEVGKLMREVEYQSVIFQTVNPETFEAVDDFTLSTPTGDIIIGPGQIPILGTITFAI